MAKTDGPAAEEQVGDQTTGGQAPGGEATGGPPAPPSSGGPASWRRRTIVSLAVGVLLAAGVAYVLSSGSGSGSGNGNGGTGSPTSPAVVSGIATAPGVSSAEAQLLTLNLFPKGQRQPAPDFHLTGRTGQPTTLAQFRGKVVIWSINDDKCTNMCALYAQDIVAADHDLGAAAKHVVFVAVNANPYHTTPATLESWSVTNDLAKLPNWVYVTGTPAQLAATWRAYHVVVETTAKNRTVTHDAVSYFVDPSGHMRAISDFTSGSISTAYYAHATAQMAVDLLPKSEQVQVGGPRIAAPVTAGATIGDQAPSFHLRTMSTGQPVTPASLRGKPLVLNFWSSTCTICDQEMPALQAIAGAYKSKLRVVGVDVADPRRTAAAFAATVGAHYQLLSDAQGTTAAAYRVSALPVTFLVSPKGKIVARHPGALTATELSFILADDFPNLPAYTLPTAP
ncbi:MAG: redoxin domain-containing protein [Acidimicrobiales bacterium]